MSPAFVTRLNRLYARLFQLRGLYAPEALSSMEEFFSRRTDLDRQAAEHRLKLIFENDPCQLARSIKVPVYAITGVLDPIVPWWPVRRWLHDHCPSLREHKVVWRADHPVLVTAPRTAAEQVLRWMSTGLPKAATPR